MKHGQTRQRLCAALFKLPDRVQVNFSSLAIGLGIRKGTLTAYLNELRDAEIIRTHPVFGGSAIEILDREELRKRAGLDESMVGGISRSGDTVGRLDEVRANRPVSLVAKT